MNIFRKSLDMMDHSEKRSGILLIGLTILKGISDTIGVASILPFLSVLGQPGLVKSNQYAAFVYNALGFSSVDNFLFALGLLVIFILVFSAILNAVTIYASNRWIGMREHCLSRRLLQTYLRQPYEYYLTRNTSDMATSILSMSRNIVTGVYKPVLQIINTVITLILISTLLIWASPVTTVIAAIFIGSSYSILYLSIRNFVNSRGHIIVKTNKLKFRSVNEAFIGIKQVKLSGLENYSLARYSKPSEKLAQTRAISSTLSQVPKFGLEAFAFGGIVMMTLYLFKESGGAESGSIQSSLPLLGLYAFAGYRLLPIMQVMYASVLTLRLNAPTVDTVYQDIKNAKNLSPLPLSASKPMPLKGSLEFDKVSYTYPGTEAIGLSDITFKITKGSNTGIVGSTGAGKTTLVDVLLGLLKTSSGKILIDGAQLHSDNIRQWQANIGYVPQDIFLSDSSVAENIAIGISKENISSEKLKQSTKTAKLFDFISKELPDGFDTIIGERGVRLSGGQRQRLGIARALYHSPQIIIFDEATSALDNATEHELIKQINEMSGERTIVMIAHRLTTIKDCDQIIMLDKGQIAGVGTYTELAQNSSSFRKMASL